MPPGVRYVPIRVPMWHCDEVDVAAVNRAIEESPKPVFIHCVAGRDRTGLAVAAWRMSHGMSADDAIMEMESFGTNPWWNAAIKRRIRRLQEERQSGNAAESAASGR